MNRKRKLLYLVFIVIIAVIVFVVNYSDKKEQKLAETNARISEVINRKDFFNVNRLINDFFEFFSSKDYDVVINILDTKYVKKNKINKENILNFIPYNYNTISFHSMKIYLKKYDKNDCYFVTGEIHGYNFSNETLQKEENVNIIVIVNNYSNTYSIMPLAKNKTIESYAKEYKIGKQEKITKNTNNRYSDKNFSDEYITRYYINYFDNILYLDNKKAYTMLSSNYKKEFRDYQDFKSKLSEISNALNGSYYSYNYDNSKKYTIKNLNMKKIVIIESSPMDYKISITDIKP